MSAAIDLRVSARKAGEDGLSYAAWACSDEVFGAVTKHGEDCLPADRQAAYQEGRRTYRLAHGWVVRWTNAESGYDTFGTETVSEHGTWNGKLLRQVLIDSAHLTFQADRYSSGLCCCWEEDPRVMEIRRREAIDRETREHLDRAGRRAAGLVWIRSADLEANEDALHVELQARALDWQDVSAEKKRRRDEKEAAERAIVWERCRATFADEVTLIDQGTEGFPGRYGWITGRPPGAWRKVVVRDHWSGPSGDADTAEVIGEGEDSAGSLADVAAKLTSGQMRIAGPDEPIAPIAVIKRVGRSFHEIGRVRIGEVTMWVDHSWGKTLVLDEKGHIVRSKKLEAHALSSRPERVQLTPLSADKWKEQRP